MSLDAESALATRPIRRARIVKKAERAAQADRETALDEIELLRAQAREEGYRAGLEAAEREASARLLTQAIETRDWVASVESQLVEATIRAVERVIDGLDDIALTRRVARAALREMRGVGAVALHVAPQVADAVRADIEEITAPFSGPLAGVEIVEVAADSSVTPGGALLKSPFGVVDARLETQMAALRESLDTAFGVARGDDGEAASDANSGGLDG